MQRSSSAHRGPPTSSGASATPTGRVELLAWMNRVVGGDYPSIESLRDGVAYLALVEATVTRTAELQRQSQTEPQSPVSVMAHQLIARMDSDVTSAIISGASVAEPSSDSIQVRERCERNFHLLQEMIRKCLPKEFAIEPNVKRLAEGRLQEHLRMLQWAVGFVKKAFTAAGRSAAASTAPASQTPRSPSASQRGRPTSSGEAKQTRSASSSVQQPRARSAGASSARVVPTRNTVAGTLPSPPAVESYDAHRYAPVASTHASKEEQHSEPVDADLTKLEADVAELEQLAWSRGPTGLTQDDSRKGHPLNTLETVRHLLHERDVLWHTLTAVEAECWRAVTRASSLGSWQPPSAASSFLREIAAVFDVPTDGVA